MDTTQNTRQADSFAILTHAIPTFVKEVEGCLAHAQKVPSDAKLAKRVALKAQERAERNMVQTGQHLTEDQRATFAPQLAQIEAMVSKIRNIVNAAK